MRKNGFTLVELITVIAIISVLAALLIPSMVGYIDKAKKTADKSAASTIGKAAMGVNAETTEKDIFAGGSDFIVSALTTSGTESYKFTALCMNDGDGWKAFDSTSDEFADLLNDESDIVEVSNGINIKYHSARKDTDCWVVGYSAENNRVEVWTGNNTGTPSYRVFPSPDKAYA